MPSVLICPPNPILPFFYSLSLGYGTAFYLIKNIPAEKNHIFDRNEY